MAQCDVVDALPAYQPGSRPKGDHPCTYGMGYVRQDVYACSKCAKKGPDGKPILTGFCLGCKNTCHVKCGAAVIDLYSKRYFRCDCGNSHMKNTCQLLPVKAATNADNARVYNHNFVGKYCRCDRPYDPKLGDMLQCAMCEDWFHEVCLKLPDRESASRTRAKLRKVSCEMICAACSDKVLFLDAYFARFGLFPPPGGLKPLGKDNAVKPADCTRPPPVDSNALRGRDRLWPGFFRTKLCKCNVCRDVYAKAGVSYIVDVKDFVNLSGIEGKDLLANAPSHEAVRKEIAKKRKKRASTPRKKPAAGAPAARPVACEPPQDMDVDEYNEKFLKPAPTSTSAAATSTATAAATDAATSTATATAAAAAAATPSVATFNGHVLPSKRRKPAPLVTITDEERDRLREEVTKFVSDSVRQSNDPTDKDATMQFLLDLRRQILASE